MRLAITGMRGCLCRPAGPRIIVLALFPPSAAGWWRCGRARVARTPRSVCANMPNHWSPARIGGNSSRLLRGGRVLSMGPIWRSGWAVKWWRRVKVAKSDPEILETVQLPPNIRPGSNHPSLTPAWSNFVASHAQDASVALQVTFPSHFMFCIPPCAFFALASAAETPPCSQPEAWTR